MLLKLYRSCFSLSSHCHPSPFPVLGAGCWVLGAGQALTEDLLSSEMPLMP